MPSIKSNTCVSRTSAYSVQSNYGECSWRAQWFLETSEILAHGQLKKLYVSMHLTLLTYLRVSEKLFISSGSIKKNHFFNTEYLPAWRFKTQPLIFICKVSLCLLILTQSFLSWESETPHKSHHLKSQMTQFLSEILHGFWFGLTHSSRTERELFSLEYLQTSLAYSYSRVSEAYGFTSRSGRTRGVRDISSQASYVSSAFLSPLDST